MTIPGAAVGLLLATGLALGILLSLLVAAAAVRRRSRPAAPPPPHPPDRPDDDLPGFLAAPPGSDGRRAVPASGWAVLSSPPDPPPAPTPPERIRTGRSVLIAALATLVLLTAFVAVMATRTTRRPPPAAEHSVARQPAPLPAVPTAPAPGDPGAGELAGADLPPARSGVRADLTFAGIVLERRAVGVTAAYPHIRVSAEGGASLAHVDLITFNCLADAAPPDPVAAGCSRVVPEYAELTSPALRVIRSPSGLTLSGRFPTYVRPNGTPAAWTGEAYELRVEVSAERAGRRGVDVPATGSLRLGEDRAPTTAVSVLRLER